MDIYQELEKGKIVPVIKLEHAEDAIPLAEALCNGGLPVAEVTFRTKAAEASIRNMCTAYPEMLVGAGSLSTVEQAKAALDAGARFLVTAGFNRKIVEFAEDSKIPIFPGICTPTEIMFLLEYGLQVAKFFPAEQFGGLRTIKALAAPFPNMRFMPTGGISASNIKEYLEFDKVIACGGSWMVTDKYISTKNFEEITRLTADAVAIVRGNAL